MASASFSSLNPTIAGDLFLVRGTQCRKPRSRPASGETGDKATPDKSDLLGLAITKVGEEAMAIVGGKPDGVSLYVEFGKGWISASIFRADRKTVQYFSPRGSNLIRLLIDARCLEPATARWWAMRYAISGGKFDAQFDYDAPATRDEDSDARRERFLRQRYGDKSVVYPPPFDESEAPPPTPVAVAIPPSPYKPPSVWNRSSRPSSSSPSGRLARPWPRSSSRS